MRRMLPAAAFISAQAILLIVCGTTLAEDVSTNPDPIVIYDLTHTLSADLANREQAERVWEECHTVVTLQGIVNRDAPRLYLLYVPWAGRNVDQVWLERLSQPGSWLHGRPREQIESLEALVERFRDRIEGVVTYDPRIWATSNLASTIAGTENLIAIRHSDDDGSVYDRLVRNGPRLPVVQSLIGDDGAPLFGGEGIIPGTKLASTGSAKCDAYLWAKTKYLDTGRCDGSYLAFYIDQYWIEKPKQASPDHHTLTNHDFFVAKRAFFCDLGVWDDEASIDDPDQTLGTDLETFKQLLLSCYEHGGRERMIHIGGFTPWAYKYTDHPGAGGKHGGVPTEWEMAKIVSAYNGFVDADALGLGSMANASFYMHYPLQDHYPQRHAPTDESLTAEGFLDGNGQLRDDGRQYVTLYVGDYDAASWLYKRALDIWDHPKRGSVPLGWSISPVLERRTPHVMAYMWETATENDGFMAADNGAGYLNPGMLQEPRPISELPSGLPSWVTHCIPMYDRWDLRITGFVIDGYAPGLNEKGLDAYAQFSPGGIVPQKVQAPASLHGDMPVLQAGPDVNQGDPQKAAQAILHNIGQRRGAIRFHWYRSILKDPGWYEAVVTELQARDENVVVLTPERFFDLLRRWLEDG